MHAPLLYYIISNVGMKQINQEQGETLICNGGHIGKYTYILITLLVLDFLTFLRGLCKTPYEVRIFVNKLERRRDSKIISLLDNFSLKLVLVETIINLFSIRPPPLDNFFSFADVDNKRFEMEKSR